MSLPMICSSAIRCRSGRSARWSVKGLPSTVRSADRVRAYLATASMVQYLSISPSTRLPRSLSSGVWLSLMKSAPAEGKRAIDVGGRKGVVAEEMEYSCDVRVDIDGVAISLRAVASDKTEWCPEAATALAAAVGKLGW